MSKKIHKELNNEKEITKCAEQFGLVGDPTRMKICWLLCKHKELSVGEIADILSVSISVVSHSLDRLRKHKLVKSRRDYKHVFYSLSNTDFNSIIRNSLEQL